MISQHQFATFGIAALISLTATAIDYGTVTIIGEYGGLNTYPTSVEIEQASTITVRDTGAAARFFDSNTTGKASILIDGGELYGDIVNVRRFDGSVVFEVKH